jgi:xanthine dehydrogenase YagS FAD-binding subunit
MIRFDYFRADNVADAIRSGTPDRAAFLAGGTDVVGLLKENVARPLALIDINRLPLREVTELAASGLRLGALVTNSGTAHDKRV